MRGTPLFLRLGLAILASASGILLLGWLVYTFLLLPQITVMAPAGSTVHLSDMQSGAQVTRITVGGSSTTMRTGIGSYKVMVSNQVGEQVFYVNTAWLKRVTLQVSSSKQLSATLLAHQVAYNAVGSNSNYAYLNTSAQTVEQVRGGIKTVLDNFGQTSPRSTTTAAQAVDVIAGNRAIVLTHSKLYVLQNGTLDELNTSGFPNSVSSLAIGTNPGQESFAILANQTLYWYPSPSAQPQELTTLTKQADQLAVGGNNIIAYSTRMPNAREDIRYAYASTYVVDPLLISTTTGSQRALAQGPLVDASISPDGQYATIEPRGSNHTDIVRLADGVTVQAVENASTLTPQWTSNTQYIYGKGSSVWAYDVETMTATALATLPSEQLITSVTYNSNLQQYLVTTYPNEQGAAVYQLQ